MIKLFEEYIDDGEWIECPPDYEFKTGEEVKMSPRGRSQYRSWGDKTGKIVSLGLCFNRYFLIDWDEGHKGVLCNRSDILIKKPNKFSEIKWFKDGKLNEIKKDAEVFQIMILDNLKDEIINNNWDMEMYYLIGKVYNGIKRHEKNKNGYNIYVNSLDKDDFYGNSSGRKWYIPKHCAEIVDNENDKIKWYKDGKLDENKDNENIEILVLSNLSYFIAKKNWHEDMFQLIGKKFSAKNKHRHFYHGMIGYDIGEWFIPEECVTILNDDFKIKWYKDGKLN